MALSAATNNAQASTGAEDSATLLASTGTGRRVIVAIVDDDLSMRRAMARLLRLAGFNALTFRSASEFLGDRHQKDVACVILDLMMPEMNGLELQARIASSGATVPIIFMTAANDPVSEARARAGGALAFLHKPFDATTLLDAVHQAVNVSGRPE